MATLPCQQEFLNLIAQGSIPPHILKVKKWCTFDVVAKNRP